MTKNGFGLLIVSAVALTVAGCASKAEPEVVTGTPTPTASTKAPATTVVSSSDDSGMAMDSSKPVVGVVKNGVFSNKEGKAICPVTGEEVTLKDAKSQIYKGVKYEFCCSSCPGMFAKNPAKYAIKS